MMDSMMMDDDPTLPIDLDKTSNFARFLDQSEKDKTLTPSRIPKPELSPKGKSRAKQRSQSANDQPEERPLSRGGTLREQENIISDLKKECFGLKMRIYYMEEQLHDAFAGDTEGTIKQNIELKVTIEEIRTDLKEKSNLLTQASQALGQLSVEKEQDIKESNEKHDLEKKQTLDECNLKLNTKDKEIRRLEDELDELKNNLDSVDGNTEKKDQIIEDKESEIQALTKELKDKDARLEKFQKTKHENEERLSNEIEELTASLESKEVNLKILKRDVDKMAASPERSNQHYKKLYEDQGREILVKTKQLNDITKDFEKKTNLVEGLKDHINGMEKSMKVMRSNLHEKEMDKQRVVSQLQEKLKNYQSLLNQKDEENSEKSESLESMKETIAKSNQERLQFQLQSSQEKDSQMIELNVKMKQQQFEIEKLKYLLEEKDKEVLYFGNKNLQLEEESTRERNEQLQSLELLKQDVKEKVACLQAALDGSQKSYKSLQGRFNQMMDEKDKTIESVTGALKFKDVLIKELLATPSGLNEDQEAITKKLQSSFQMLQKRSEDQELKYLDQMQNKDNDILDLTNQIQQATLTTQKSQAFVYNLQSKIKGLNANADEDNEILNKLRNSLKNAIDKERASRKDLVDTLNEKEEEISKLSAFAQSQKNRIENFHNSMKSLASQLPEEKYNSIIEELIKANNTPEIVQKIKSDAHEEVKLKNEELLSLLKEKDNLVKDLYKMLHENQRKKNDVIQQLEDMNVTSKQELKDLKDQLTALQKKSEIDGISNERKTTIKDQSIQGLADSNKEKDGIILDLQGKRQPENTASRRKEMDDLEDICHSLEDEKMQLQAEMDLLKLSKQSLQNQLEGAYDRLSRQGTPDYKDTLLHELEELVHAAEKEKEKYQTLSEKLKNNQHPESCLKLLKNEIAEVEHLRRNLQNILLNVMKKQPELESFKEQLIQENRELKLKLKEMPPKSLDISAIIDEAESESRSLKEDLKRCELEAKQLNTQLDTMKLDYEQLVHDRDQEISQMTDRINELKQDKELLTRQRNQLKSDLASCHQQLALLNQRVEEDQGEWKDVIAEQKVTIDLKEKQIDDLRNEKNELGSKLSETESDLKALNENLQRMRQPDVTSSEKKQLSHALEEKKRLKQDAKELCNINDRLRSKLKDLTNNYEVLKKDKDHEKSKLHEELQKALKTVETLQDDIQKRQRSFELEKNEMENETATKMEEFRKSFEKEKERLQEKMDELIKVNELQHNLTSPELQQLRDENLALTSENNQLKIERLEQSPRNNDFKTVSLRLGDCQQRNKKLQDELSAALANQKRLQHEVEQWEKSAGKNTNVDKEVKDLKRVKDLLEKQLREAKESENSMKEQVTLSQEVVTSKNKAISNLQSKIDSMESGIGQSFSPLQTSSHRHNIRPDSRENSSHSPDDMSLIAQHIKEMRELNKQLQETRKNNDALRQQLEERLKHVEHEAKMLNDPKNLQITLIRDNDSLREKLAEVESRNEKMKSRVDELMTDKENDKETIETLHVELHELNNISHNLKLEMEAYDRLVKQLGISRFKENEEESKEKSDHLDKTLLTALLEEIRDLREQLTKSIDANIALKEKLEKEIGRPVSISPLVTPSKDPSMSAKRSLFSAVLQSVSVDGGGNNRNKEKEKARVHFSPFETPTRDYNISSDRDISHESITSNQSPHDRCQLIGSWADYRTVLDQVKEVISLVVTMHKRISTKEQLNQSQTTNDLSNILKRMKTVNRIFHSFVPHDHDNQSALKEENLKLKKSIASLKKTLKSKEYFIKSAVEMVEENAKWRGKSNEDKSITKKLMKTRDTLKATRGTMELKSKKAQEKASLDNSFVTSPSTSFEEMSSPKTP